MERVHDIRHDLLVIATHLSDQAMEHQACHMAFLDWNVWNPFVHRPHLHCRTDSRFDVASSRRKRPITVPIFLQTVQAILPMYWFRAAGGVLFIAGGVMCAINFFMTWLSRPAVYEEPVYTAPKLSSGYVDAPLPPSQLTGRSGSCQET